MLDLTMWAVIPLLIASATAATTSYLFMGQNVLYQFQLTEQFQMGQIHWYLLLGVVAGLTSLAGMFLLFPQPSLLECRDPPTSLSSRRSD